MKTFKEYYWLAPAAAMAGQAMRISPQTLAQLPSQTYDKVKSGINTVKKIGSTIKKKYKNRKVMGVKSANEEQNLSELSPALMNRYKKASMGSSYTSNQQYGRIASTSGLGKKFKDDKLKKLKQTMDKRDRGFNLAVKRTGTPGQQKEMMTAGHAGIPQDTKNMGPRKKGKRFTTQNFVDGRKRKDNPFPLLRRFNAWNTNNG